MVQLESWEEEEYFSFIIRFFPIKDTDKEKHGVMIDDFGKYTTILISFHATFFSKTTCRFKKLFLNDKRKIG